MVEHEIADFEDDARDSFELSVVFSGDDFFQKLTSRESISFFRNRMSDSWSSVVLRMASHTE